MPLLASLITRFSQHLSEHGIAEPVIHAVSAREGCDSGTLSPWNQFWNFRNQIFRLRDAKEVREIKAANLDVAVRQLARVLEKEVFGLSILHRVLRDSVGELEQRRSEWRRMGQDAFHRVLERRLEEEFMQQPVPSHALVGAGAAIAIMARDWKRLTARSEERLPIVDFLLKEGAFQSLQHEFERLEDRITYHSLHQGLPSSIGDYCRGFFDANAAWNEFLQRVHNELTRISRKSSGPAAQRFQGRSIRLLPGSLCLAASRSDW